MRGLARTLLALAAVSSFCASFSAACAKGQSSQPALASSGKGAPDDAGATPDANDAAADGSLDGGSRPSMDLRGAVVREAWPEAHAKLSALPKDVQSKPLHRYLAAKIARALEQPDGVLSALDRLETELPELRERILRLRAEAAEEKGLYDVAATIWLGQGGSRAALRAARARAKAKDRDGLEHAVRLVLADARRTVDEEVEARGLRAASFPNKDDARWLAVHAPGHAEANLPETPALTESERRTRIDAWTRVGRVDEALRDLEGAEKAGSIPRKTACGMRAHILYGARSRYAEAASAHAACAAMGGKEQPEHLFYEARSFSRANQDDQAIRKYADLAKRFPRSPFAAQALQLRARLLTLNGRFDEAAKAWDALPSSDDRNRLRGLAHLLAGHAREARDQFDKATNELGTGARHRGATSASGQLLRLRELQALAMDAAGDKNGAIDRWKAITREAPFSYAALVSRARLAERSVTVDSPPPWPPFPKALPAPGSSTNASSFQRYVALLELGLGEEAEAHLRASPRAASDGGPFCEWFAPTGRAKERFRLSNGATPSHENDCRFPTPFAELVGEAAAAANVPVPFVYAIMRTESAFDPDVHSPAAAVGLMQLLPDTAKKVGEKAGLPAAPLEDPRTNIYLGARYLADLQEELKAPLPLVAAAYNAGPEAVLRWLSHLRGPTTSKSPNALQVDVALFCELIPYTETRAYVFQVMESYANYAHRAGTASAHNADGAETLPRFSLSLPAL